MVFGVCVLSSIQLFAAPRTIAPQVPLSMEFSRQEYWSGLPFPPPGDLPNPRIEPASLASPALAGGFFTTEPPRKPQVGRWGLVAGPCHRVSQLGCRETQLARSLRTGNDRVPGRQSRILGRPGRASNKSTALSSWIPEQEKLVSLWAWRPQA